MLTGRRPLPRAWGMPLVPARAVGRSLQEVPTLEECRVCMYTRDRPQRLQGDEPPRRDTCLPGE
eukprot:354903-Chlamydomonas_euryale.AAC.22